MWPTPLLWGNGIEASLVALVPVGGGWVLATRCMLFGPSDFDRDRNNIVMLPKRYQKVISL
jgi:hypothetical protein